MAPLSQRTQRPAEQPFVEIATTVPSFAGFFLEGDALVGLVSDPTDAVAAQEALGTFRAFRATSGDAEIASKQVVIREARYSFRELAAWRDLAFEHVFPRDDVVSLDLDEQANSVDIGLASQAIRDEVQNTLLALGVPLEAVRFEASRRMTPGSHVTLRDYSRPVRGGFESRTSDQFGAYVTTCTLGFNAKVYANNLVFTNSHCTAELWDDDNGGIYQDSIHPNHFLGYEYSDPDADSCGIPGFQHPCRYSDAAAFKYKDGVDVDFGHIARTLGPPATNWGSSGSRTIDDSEPRFRITSASDPIDNGAVEKIGRTTGWTKGTVEDTCVDRGSTNDDGERLCQMMATFYFNQGDSGSPVFTRIGDDVTLRGIAWGGDGGIQQSVFSPWSGLVADFGSFDVVIPPMAVWVSAPGSGEPYSSVTAQANVQNGVPPYTYSWTIDGSPACGNTSSCQGQLGGSGTYTTFEVLVTDDESEQESDQASVLAEWEGCPECPFAPPPGSRR